MENIEKLMLIIGHRFPRLWFDLWVIEQENPKNVEKVTIELAEKCFNKFSVQEQLKIKAILQDIRKEKTNANRGND
jgi:hypothetical protein